MIPSILAVLISYIIGSTPFGLLVARYIKKIDIRTVGSGNIGATNVGRTLGFRWFVIVTILDALKGALPVMFLPGLLTEGSELFNAHLQVLCGLAAVGGHMYPLWLKFKGGKGVATSLGVILVIGPKASFAAALVFLITFGIWRTISLSSMLAAVAFGAVQLWLLTQVSVFNWSLAIFAIAVPGLIIYRHKENIKRIWRGEESVIGKKKPDE